MCKMRAVSPGSCAGGKNRKCGFPSGVSGSKKNNIREEFIRFPPTFIYKTKREMLFMLFSECIQRSYWVLYLFF